jgi:putative peptidoglycan lipid II flippase
MVGYVGIMKSTVQVGLDWWDAWQKRSVNTSIFSAMVTVGGITMCVKLAAGVKDVVIAMQFGTSDAFDAFLIAFVLPAFAINLIGGSLNAALIPTYIQVQAQEGTQAAQQLLSSVMVWTIGVLVALSVVLALASPYLFPLMASGFTADKLALVQSLYYLMLPTLVLSGIATIWRALLNACDRFALAAIVPLATSLVTVLIVVGMAERWDSHSIALGLVIGALVETAILGWGLSREGVSLVPRWHGASPAVKQVLGQYVPMVAGAFLMGGADLVSQSMAAMLSPGSVSALSYGSKVTSLMLGIGALAVSTAVLPHFSRMVAVRDWRGLRHTLLTYSRWLLIGTLPVTAALIYYSESVVALVFQRGVFSAADTHLVAQIQMMYLLQVPLYIVSMLFVRLISALKANQVFMWGNAINLSMCILLTYVLMQWVGVIGIALATSLMYLISCGFLLWVSLRLMQAKAEGRE